MNALPRAEDVGQIADAGAEAGVAGWLLNCVDQDSPADLERVADITAQHFVADPIAREVFGACIKLHAAAKRVGFASVAGELAGRIAPTDISQLQNAAPTSAYFADHLATLRELHQRRQIRLAGIRLKEAAEIGEGLDRAKSDTIAVLENRGGTISTTWPAPVSACDLCAAPPPTPPVLIDGALYRGGTMLLTGPSKAAKTWTMMDLGLAVATGADWLGFATTAAPVLYLNLEVPAFVAQKRIRTLADRRKIAPPPNFVLWNLRGFRVTIEDLERELPRRIAKDGVGLVVLDPHYKVSAVSGFEENSNDGQGELLSRLEGIATASGTALAIAHHFAKGSAADKNAIDRASGGGVFARWPDAFCAMTPHEEDGAMSLEFVLRAFAPVPPCVVRWEFPAWVRDDTLDPARLKRAGGPIDKHPASEALSALRNGTTGKDWREALGWGESTFRRKRDELVADHKVRETAGLYYRLTA